MYCCSAFLLCLTVSSGVIVLLTVCVYSSKHGVLYTIGISMTRFKKSVGPSACLSVRPFATLTKKPTPPLLTVE